MCQERTANDPIADTHHPPRFDADKMEPVNEPNLKTSSLPIAGGLAFSRCRFGNAMV